MIVEKSLSDVAKVFNGKTPAKIEKRQSGHPVLKIKDVTEEGLFRGNFDSFVDQELGNKFKSKLIREGDVLILNAAHNASYVGSKIYRAESQVIGSLPIGEWLVVRPSAEEVDHRFLYYWVISSATRHEIVHRVKGIHLYPKDVAGISISLPPLPEQRHIAAILDKADEIRGKRQRAIDRLGDFLRSVFLDMFGDPVTNPKGWNLVKLVDIATRFSDGPFGSNLKTSHYVDVGIRVVRLQNIGVGQFLDEDKAFISEQHFTSIKKHECLP
ncbi:MAG: restriction endonuclease subunit S, partial [Nitrososphaera sp.]|nr:restriction endonuclease subunit S [Nitrososphaera sp.]